MKQKYSDGDCYKILSISPGCSWEELRKAYKLQIKKWHPDRFPADSKEKLLAEGKIKYITAAYHQMSEYYRENGTLPGGNDNKTEQQSYSTDRFSDNHQPAPGDEQATEVTDSSARVYTEKQFRKSFHYLVIIFIFAFLAYTIFSQNPDQNIRQHTENASQNTVSGSKTHFSRSKPVSQPQNNTVYSKNAPEASLNSTHTATDSSQTKKSHTQDRDEDTDFFTLGSPIGEVILVQGAPSRVEGDTWFYGESEVYFYEGLVIDWKRKHGSPLKARIVIDKSNTDIHDTDPDSN